MAKRGSFVPAGSLSAPGSAPPHQQVKANKGAREDKAGKKTGNKRRPPVADPESSGRRARGVGRVLLRGRWSPMRMNGSRLATPSSDRLAAMSDTTFDVLPSEWQTFQDFLRAAPVWTDTEASYVFHVANELPLPQRREPASGRCHVHAAIVLQRYLVSLRRPDEAGMIDMVKLMRETWSAADVSRNALFNTGGNSELMTRTILEPGSALHMSDPAQYANHLRTYGPGLVSIFVVHADFAAADKVSFDGTPEGRRLGSHAMLLIGARRDAATGKEWFLLQNWWTRSQFVEVSGKYLQQCCPRVSFVTTPQTRIPGGFATHKHLYAEQVDMGEFQVAACPLGG